MANHKSATKRAKQNVKRRARNKSYISKVKTAVKKFKQGALAGTGKDALQQLMVEAQVLLNRAAAKGVLHKNNASRRIGRLAESFNKVVSK